MTVLDNIRAHARHRRLTWAELSAENGRLKRALAEAEQERGESDIAAACALAKVERLEDQLSRIDDRWSEIVDSRDQVIEELEHRLGIAVLAECVVTQTQEIDTRTLVARFEEGPVVRLGASPLTDNEITQPLPVLDPGRIPAWAKTQPIPVA